MIFFDTETTGLITNEALPLAQQPRIIEFGALKVNDAGETIGVLESRINPGVPLPAIITKITGLRDTDLVDAPRFEAMVPQLADFFRGERVMLAHNAWFDLMMLVFELRRAEAQWRFPFCSEVIDTRERWSGKLADWGRRVKGAEFVQEHRALSDAQLLRDCWFAGEGAQ